MKSRNRVFERLLYKIALMVMILSLLSGGFTTISQAKSEDPPEEYRGKPITLDRREGSSTIQEESFGIAWADPDGPHSVYAWPFTFDQMGLVIQSYQNYSSGTSAAYFHHGIDMVAPNGTQVFTRSGGQVVNIENYQPGNRLYWEIAILDPEGYVWQYHHIDQTTIPQLIYDKFAEWQANPDTGGYIPPDTRIGNIIYWPVVSMGYRFNHIHLNILADGDVYLNGLEFHTPIEDTQAPEIQAIGLLNGNTIVSGNTASGNYGMYVRARDLYKSTVYYLPPYKTEFSIDGGEWVTVWEFHNFPGGFDDQAYVNDFFVPVYTKGNYDSRDFYIDLGFTTSGQRTFPSEPGEHSIDVCVWDYYGNNTCDSFSWNVAVAIPDNGCSTGNGVTRVFEVNEDLIVTDVNLGLNISHASRGQVRVTLKSPSDVTATTIISNSSDTYDNYDVWIDDSSNNPINDGNNDSVAAPYFDRIAGPSPNGALDSFNGKTTYGEWTVFICDNSSGTTGTANLIDLEVIGTDHDNEPPVADPKTVTTSEDTEVSITLSGSDPDENPLTFSVVTNPAHGTLSGTAPNLTYTPAADYNGTDSFTYKANDGIADSNPATVSISVSAVNDAPVAQAQSVNTEVNLPVAITLAGSDVEGDTLTFTVLSDPEHGSLSGTVPDLQYTPISGYTGSDSFTFKVNDGFLDSEAATVNITINPPGPFQVFWDDFEDDLGWVDDPNGTDTATLGVWEWAIPQTVTYNSYVTQLGTPVSGERDLVTGPLAGSSAGSYDVDNGLTSIQSPQINLPANSELTLTFSYYLAHLNNSSSDDYFRAKVVGDSTETVYEKLGSSSYVNAVWQQESVDLSAFAGQSIYILFEAGDVGEASLVEAAVDDVLIKGLVTNPNNAPVADDQSVTTDEDIAVGITLAGSDVDGDPLNFTLTSQPTKGTLSGTAPDLTYTPNENFNGVDSFTFKVDDGQLSSDPATVSITVIPVNDAPVAITQSVTLDEDSSIEITLGGIDIDGDGLTYTVVTNPTNGSFDGEAPNLIYTPAENFNGADSFTFMVDDGQLTSEPATVNITINPVNDAPLAYEQSVTVDEDSSVDITLNGTDADGDTLTYSVQTGPEHGSLSGDVPALIYTPESDYNGSDSFTFTVYDGQLTSAPATVSITVNPVNDVPIANAQSVDTDENTAVSVTLTGTDIDEDELTFEVTSGPSNGSLTGTAPNLTYTPNAGYFGSDSFEFTVSDGTATSSAALVSIRVTDVNAPPVANGQEVNTIEDTAIGITLTGTDSDDDPLSFTLVDQPTNGSLSGTAPTLTYTPHANYNGADSFTFTVFDGQLTSAPAMVSITVNAVNDAPVADAQSVTTDEDASIDITLTGSDVDGDTLSFMVVTEPSHGSLEGTMPNLTYTPDTDYNGVDSFTFKVNDGTVDSAPVTVSITVNAVNDTPVADGQSVTLDEDASIGITLSGTDIDGDSLIYTVQTQPTNGILSGDAPDLTYTPNADYNGADSFTFKVNDGTVDSSSATVSITVTPINDAPIANPQSVITNENTAVGITLTGTDIDEDELTFEVTSDPSHGSLSGIAPDLTYTPSVGYFGSDSFEFTVSDGTATSSAAEVSITVTDVNWPPVANGQEVNTNEDTALGITLTGTDPDGNTLNYSVTGEPTNGTISGTAPELTYTPDADYNGADSFTFTVDDGQLTSDPATIQITVNAVNDAPVAEAQSVSVDEDASIEITLNGTDVDGDPITYAIQTAPEHGNLSGTGAAQTYTPYTDLNGADSFTFVVNDGTVESVSATVNITINPVNDAPVADPQSVVTNENTAATITLTGSDVDGDSLTYAVTVEPTNGTLTGTAPDLIYTPDTGFDGSDSIEFTVTDGTVTSSPAVVSITVTDVNSAPIAEGQTVSTDEDTALAVTLTGIDPDGNPLNYAVTEQPTNGTLSGTEPELIYTPNDNFYGADSFTFTVEDGQLTSDPATVSIAVSPVNDAPLADEKSVTVDEDSSVDVTLSGTDVDGDELTYTVATGPANGTLSGDAHALTYTPDPDFNGSDSFTFVVNDGAVDSASATVSITVNPVNDEPVAVAQSVTVDEDSSEEITLSGTDADGDTLTYSVQTGPEHGSLSGDVPALIYTPEADYNGSDSFTFVANDSTGASAPATVSITVDLVNDAPVVSDIPDQTINVGESFMAINLDNYVSDVDNTDAEMVWSYAGATELLVIIENMVAMITVPDAEWSGSETITFRATDPGLLFDEDPASFTVTTVNHAPIANSQALSTNENTSLEIKLSGSDIDNDPLTFRVISGPSHGNLSGTGANLLYSPDSGYSGLDLFTFVVNDGKVDSEPATISIAILEVNYLPVVFNQSLSTDEDIDLAIKLTGEDQDGDPLDFFILTGPTHGSLSGEAPNLVYTPSLNFNGSDSFTFYANDGQGDSEPGAITITVDPVNDAPIAKSQAVTTEQDSSINITLSGSDVEDAVLIFAVLDGPSNGNLSEFYPEVTYAPDSGFSGEDSFTFVVNDGELDSTPATVTITVTPSGPTQIFWDDFETDKGWVTDPYGNDNATTGTWERANPETVDYYGLKQLGDTVSGSYDLVTGALAGRDAGSYDIDNGLTSILSPEIELPGGRELSLSFYSYLAHASNSSSSDYLKVSIIGTNSERVFEDLGGSFDDDASWVFTEVDISQFGGQTVRILIEAADAGTASLVEAGVDDVLVMAKKANNPPTAIPQSLGLDEDETLDILLTGSDPDGNILDFEIVEDPQHGSLSGNLPDLTYTPDANYNGVDRFSFTVNDGIISSEPATIELEVIAVNDAPIADPLTVLTQIDTPVEVLLSGSDIEDDTLDYVIKSDPVHGELSGTLPNLVYTPDTGFSGEDAFSFQVSDGLLTSEIAVVDITITPAGPVTIFFDDFETDQGWLFNPVGSNTATAGKWARAIPTPVDYYGSKQLAAFSGSYDLVTGPAGASWWWWWFRSVDDVNDGVTSVRSPEITLPVGREIALSLQYYFAHANNSSSSDYLRISAVGSTTQILYEEVGSNSDDDAVWESLSVDLSGFAGQTIYLLVEAADNATSSLVEAAIDDVMIVAE